MHDEASANSDEVICTTKADTAVSTTIGAGNLEQPANASAASVQILQKVYTCDQPFQMALSPTSGSSEPSHPQGDNPSSGHKLAAGGSSNFGSRGASSSSLKRFSGATLDSLLFIELCSGSGVLSKAARQRGFRSMEVDNSVRRAPGKQVLRIDLASPEQVEAVSELMQANPKTIAMIFGAPPCGTASLAREKDIPSLSRQGFDLPKPLRSEAQPDGLDGLSSENKSRVELANQLYHNMVRLMLLAFELGIPAVLENPKSSRFWETSFAAPLFAIAHHIVTFSNCSHGGDRPKLTTLWCTHSFLSSLAILCDNKHVHKSWKPFVKSSNGKKRLAFPTSDEAQYPDLLCERIISNLADYCKEQGALEPSDLPEQRFVADAPLDRITLGALPRGTKVKPLVSEFEDYIRLVCSAQHSPQLHAVLENLPKGSRITARRVVQWGSLQASDSWKFLDNIPSPLVERSLRNKPPSESPSLSSLSVEVCTVGVPSDPINFLRRAVAAGHPRGMEMFLGEAVDQALRDNFLNEPFSVAKKRIDFFKRWNERARLLQPREDELHAKLPPYLRHLLKGKRMLLWSEMLEELGYPDKELINDMQKGFKLSGWLGESHVFPRRVRRPENTVSDLKAMSPGLNKSTMDRAQKRQADEIAVASWDLTQEEINNGWVFREDGAGPSDAILALRFGLPQSEKIRLIDDCRPINRAAGLKEKLKVQSVDRFCSMVARAFQLHDAEKPGQPFPKLVGRTLDLKAAYKQFGISEDDRKWLRLVTWEPGCQVPTILGVNAMPFGAVGSVSGFLRISVSIYIIGLRMLSLCWTAYFDDYPCLSRSELQKSTDHAMTGLFDLLGVRYASEGKKAAPFSDVFRMLGLRINLQNSQSLRVEVGHTDERRAELTNTLDTLLQQESLDYKELERLRGRMVFFEGYAFGRVANWAHKVISKAISSHHDRVPMSGDMSKALAFLRTRIGFAKPLTIEKIRLRTWIVFTDGACESGVGSVGGVLVSPEGDIRNHFGEEVPGNIMSRLFETSQNPIYELEVMPVLLASQIWMQELQSCQVVFYMDNEAARTAYIKAQGATDAAEAMVRDYANLELRMQLSTWFARVPTHSNLSDGPSRLDFALVEVNGSRLSKVDWSAVRLV